MRKTRLPSAAAVALAATFLASHTSPVAACSIETAYIGSICIVGEGYCPKDFVPALGQLLPTQQYQALFSLLGTQFGGDGNATFALPDLRGRMPVGAGPRRLIDVQPGWSVGQEQVTLTTANMPPHTHAATFTPTNGAGLTAAATVQAVGNSTSATSAAPSAGTPYLAGGTVAKMWAPTLNNAVTVQGLTATVGGGLTNPVAINDNAGGGQPVSLLPPQLGLTYCIAALGIYPPRP